MGLEIETSEQGEAAQAGRRLCAGTRWTLLPMATSWEEWLQTHRIELNAMTTPQFIDWLDAKMAEHGDGKLVPPQTVVKAELELSSQPKCAPP